jgi:hypothetical protein
MSTRTQTRITIYQDKGQVIEKTCPPTLSVLSSAPSWACVSLPTYPVRASMLLALPDVAPGARRAISPSFSPETCIVHPRTL